MGRKATGCRALFESSGSAGTTGAARSGEPPNCAVGPQRRDFGIATDQARVNRVSVFFRSRIVGGIEVARVRRAIAGNFHDDRLIAGLREMIHPSWF